MAALISRLRDLAPDLGEPSVAESNIASGVAALEAVLAGSTAVEDLRRGAFASPYEALQVLPQLMADAIVVGIERGLLPVDPTLPFPPAAPSRPLVTDVADTIAHAPEERGPAPEAIPPAYAADAGAEFGDFRAILCGMGARAQDFEEALTAAFNDGLGQADTISPSEAQALREGFAKAAAAVHLVPGGADTVHRYLSQRRRDPRIRRWGARVRALVRQARIPLPRLRVSTRRRVHAGRAPRRRSHHHTSASSRAGPQDGPESEEPASGRRAHLAERRGVS
jgi:hypothetical protein